MEKGVVGRSASMTGFVSSGVKFAARTGPNRCARKGSRVTVRASMVQGKIEVIRKADEETISKMGCRSWPIWECEVSKFPWTYEANENCLLLEGEVAVTPDGESEAVKFEKGDIVTFPVGMSCVWDVTKPVRKHYNFF